MGNGAGAGSPEILCENKTPLLSRVYAPLICAALSAVMMNFGFSFLFLAPLGFAVLRNFKNAPLVFAAAVSVNGALSLFLRARLGVGMSGFELDFFYFATLSAVFIRLLSAWENPQEAHRAMLFRKSYQLIAAAAFCAVPFLLVVFDTQSSSGLATSLRAQADVFSMLLINTAGADVARRSYLEQNMTAQRVLEILRNVTLRGGAVAFMLLLFYANRRMAMAANWIAQKRKSKAISPAISPALAPDLPFFHAPANAIWCLSFSIGGVLLAMLTDFTVLEVAAWNALVVCVMIFLAQGAGIVIYGLAKLNLSPILKLFFNILIFVIIISPGVNTVALAALVFLGIAENWLPIRTAKNGGPSRTPGE